jgi:cytidylate kinase
MLQRGELADFDEVRRAIIERDHRDSTRAVAPLVRPEGAVVIDTSEMTIEQVVAELLRIVESTA